MNKTKMWFNAPLAPVIWAKKLQKELMLRSYHWNHLPIMEGTLALFCGYGDYSDIFGTRKVIYGGNNGRFGKP